MLSRVRAAWVRPVRLRSLSKIVSHGLNKRVPAFQLCIHISLSGSSSHTSASVPR
jgi:hypothetical protein